MVAPPVVELGPGPFVSKAINSDFLEGDTGTIGLEEDEAVAVAAGIENPTTEDVGRVLRVVGPEDGDAVDEEVDEEGRRRSAHDFLTVAGANDAGGGGAAKTSGTAAAGGVGVDDWTGVSSVVVIGDSWLMTAVEDTEDSGTVMEVGIAVGIADVDNKTIGGADDDSSSNSGRIVSD